MFNVSTKSAVPGTLSAGLIRLDKPKYYTRLAHLRDDEMYGIGRTTLVKRWSIISPGVTATMVINGVHIALEGMDGRNFDCCYIRRALRDIIPMSPTENMLCNAEATLFGTQLLSTEYYRYFPTLFLSDMIFTGELCVHFIPSCSSGTLPPRIDIEEEYAISEAQLHQRLSSGETLEDIDINCRSISSEVSLAPA